MAYLASNEPYQRVDDGIGEGLVAGAVAGAAAIGGAKMILPRIPQTVKTAKIDNDLGSINIDESVLKKLTDEQKAAMGIPKNLKAGSRPSRAAELNKSLFGSGRRRAAIAAGVSVLGGALIGAGLDALND